MNPWLEWGIALIEWLQNLGPIWVAPMQFFSLLGTENFYLIIMPALLWCFDAALGIRVGLILLVSANLNATLKLLFAWPRPYWVSSSVRALSAETSFGFPSGHAQNATSLWGRLAAGLKQRWAQWLCLFVILMISLSRMLLAVHFPADVLGGWLFGGLLLLAFLAGDKPVRGWFSRQPAWRGIIALFLFSALLIALGFAAAYSASLRGLPEAWITAAALATPEAEAIDPFNTDGLISSAAVLFGLGSGAVLLSKGTGFDAGGPWSQRAARYGIGLVGVIVLYFGLRLAFPQGETILAQALRYVRYALVGFWITYLAPKVFKALKIA